MKNKMISTRGQDIASIDEAILRGLAKDGGLYVPEKFPKYVIADFNQLEDLAEFATHLLTPFFTDSSLIIDAHFCTTVFNFPLPLKHLENKKYVVELFHGPTLSFKDFGARFFAQCLEGLANNKGMHVLVATSGDTGSAVAGAFHGKKNIKGCILFPKDKISLRQQAQITCWGDNITALAVKGTFDQCQQLVKTAFIKNTKQHLTTANSINIARLLPQILFYAYTSVHIQKKHQQLANFIVPSGNLGNVTACYWAKELGFPIDQIAIATNANRVLSDYLESGIYNPRDSLMTLANAMDVGNPSNLERLQHLFKDFPLLQHHLDVRSVDDEHIKVAILDCYNRYHYLICPHSATAYQRLSKMDTDKPWIMIATAHPAKFNDIIEPLVDFEIPIPKSLNLLLKKKQYFEVIEPLYEALAAFI